LIRQVNQSDPLKNQRGRSMKIAPQPTLCTIMTAPLSNDNGSVREPAVSRKGED